MDPAARLFRRCVEERDPTSWEELVDRFDGSVRERLRSTLFRCRLPPCPEVVEELAQETWCHLLIRGARGFRGETEDQVVGYLARIARNVVMDRLRRSSALKRAAECRPGPLDQQEVERYPDPHPSPEERCLTKERRSVFLRACRELVGGRSPERDLRVLRWAWVDGWTSREISRALGHELGPTGVDSLLHRMRKRFADRGMGIPVRSAGRRPSAVPDRVSDQGPERAKIQSSGSTPGSGRR